MKLLVAYYDYGQGRHSRSRAREHLPLFDGITGKVKPLCGVTMREDGLTWKVIDGKQGYLCRECQRASDQCTFERAELAAWNAGEPIR